VRPSKIIANFIISIIISISGSSSKLQPSLAVPLSRLCSCSRRLHMQALDILPPYITITITITIIIISSSSSIIFFIIFQPAALPRLSHALPVPSHHSLARASAAVCCQVLPHLNHRHTIA
jgi:hypothetical protein